MISSQVKGALKFMAIQWEKCTNWNIGTYMSNQTIRINLIVHCMSNQIFSYRNISASMSANPLVKEIQASRNKIVQFKYSSESHEHRYSLFYFLIMLFTPVFHKALGRSRRCGHIVPPALKPCVFLLFPLFWLGFRKYFQFQIHKSGVVSYWDSYG